MAKYVVLALLAHLASHALAAEQRASAQLVSNPIRKVVTLLQSMQKKVEEEGAREKELYDKFVCYYKTGRGDLAKSIADGEAKSGSLVADIEANKGKLEGAKADLAQAQADRTAGKEAVAQATSLREKEAAAFAAEKADYDTNLAAIAKAVAALEKGAAGSFLQTAAAQSLRRLATDSTDVSDADRQVLVSFLSEGADYAPQSGSITGILKQIGDTMAKALADATATEQAAIASFEELVAAKTKEIEALTATIEAKTTQVGELGVLIVQQEADLKDTAGTLLEDKKFLAELETSYTTKVAEWETRSKTRAEELVALADTIKVLNDDDALELFKKTLPSAGASLLQVQVGAAAVRRVALEAVRKAQRAARREDRAALDLIALALVGRRGKAKGGFEKVIELVDTLVATLKKEQQDDDAKKEYCAKQLDETEDKKKEQELTISDLEKAIATAEQAIATLGAEILALEEGIKALDKSVAEATEQRKEENEEYKDLVASDSAAKELLVFAKNRLNKFYNPKLYKAPPKTELSAEDRTFSAMGGTITTAAPGGIAGTGIAVLAQVRAHAHRSDDVEAPAPPPETWGAYQTKSEEGTGVIAMIDLLIKDLDKELVEAETSEKDAQGDYEQLVKDAADKRAADLKAHGEKLSAKADTEGRLEADKQTKGSTVKELLATVEILQSLHGECDWLIKYFDTRKDARAGEVDALTKAKAVLSGADFSLLQTAKRGGHLRQTDGRRRGAR